MRGLGCFLPVAYTVSHMLPVSSHSHMQDEEEEDEEEEEEEEGEEEEL